MCSAISSVNFCGIMYIDHCDYGHMGDNPIFLQQYIFDGSTNDYPAIFSDLISSAVF